MAETDFDGKLVLITGGGSGIGAATARELARRGARVVLADRDLATAQAVAADIGPQARAETLDVCDAAAVTALFDRLKGEGLVVDVLVNSAGVRSISGPLEVTMEEWNSVMTINVTGSFLTCQAFGRQLRDAERGGAIVNVASTSGIIASESRTAYVASKHGVVGLTRQLSLDLAHLGIRVNAVAPGIIRTPLTEFYFDDPETVKRINHAYPLGRVGEAEDVAPVIAFLASDGARYVTGAIVPVDGGYTAGRRK